MRTLRRSCAACAKLKHRCDLRTPRCSRCIKRKVLCVYANEPSAPPVATGSCNGALIGLSNGSSTLDSYRFGSFDPFDSYPPTRLPREQVQRLIYSFLHKIAFQYYPLDLSTTSNPFLVSWWPLALGDPALFHVSLQTACLDEERSAQKGFQSSEILMADSVSLLRRKIGNTSLAVQDGTINSVITLATIEFGKGNYETSKIHIEGVKRLVDLRGGISSVRQTSPLTARMVSWVSLLVMGHPQFETQDDAGMGDGIPPISEWQIESVATPNNNTNEVIDVNVVVDYEVMNIFIRLRNVFERTRRVPFTATQLHDLTCFVVHRLLSSSHEEFDTYSSVTTQCLQYALVIYMFSVQGPTYYTHAVILDSTIAKFMRNLQRLENISQGCGTLTVWFLAVGMIASVGTAYYGWFTEAARAMAISLHIEDSTDALVRIKSVLWLGKSTDGFYFPLSLGSPH
ncbi:hypothetical protein N7532_011357 [Penicillium argentinense]|uniref:Zn(2)-C6 fungal-type domain-containing protein n=1 Tax=Penicillium argentinense TaxID=1131581 RepID=A0A9W9EID3_9EURO|nr:uncharacterized protein N7532_011357 [Penicillium argentinense]KAJ5082314.1 hypothetical protein N7532_011357 [Penicillium argentinense]